MNGAGRRPNIAWPRRNRRRRRATIMDDYDFARDMTAEQIQLARAAGMLTRRQASGLNLYDALKIGEALLGGRAGAMKAAGSNQPSGHGYAGAFVAWKKQFGFTPSKGLPLPPAYLDNCILAAANRTVVDKIIAELSPAQRAEMGIWGLAARVRKELKREPAEPRMAVSGQILDDQVSTLGLQDELGKSAAATLHRFGLVIDEDGDLVVIDEEKFETWLAARRRPRALIEGRAEG
jgi:hypothetical protein